MKIKNNPSSANTSNARPLFTGIFPLQWVGVNPTLEELNGLGFPYKNEPTYKTEQDGVETLNLDLYFLIDQGLEDGDHCVSRRIRLVNEDRPVSQSGNAEYINERGQVRWFREGNVPSDFGEHRRTRSGEGDLQSFLFAFFGMNPNDKEVVLTLENTDALYAGDVSELTEALSGNQDRRVKGMLGVRKNEDKMYQSMANIFVSSNYHPKDGDFFTRSILGKNKDGTANSYGYKDEFDSFEPKVYVPKITIDSPTVTDDDMPF